VCGTLLTPILIERQIPPRPPRHVEIDDGDAIVLLSDGLTESGRSPHPYSYQFTRIIERNATDSARALCEMIVDDWRRYPTHAELDDVTIVILAIRSIRPPERHERQEC